MSLSSGRKNARGAYKSNNEGSNKRSSNYLEEKLNFDLEKESLEVEEKPKLDLSTLPTIEDDTVEDKKEDSKISSVSKFMNKPSEEVVVRPKTKVRTIALTEEVDTVLNLMIYDADGKMKKGVKGTLSKFINNAIIEALVKEEIVNKDFRQFLEK